MSDKTKVALLVAVATGLCATVAAAQVTWYVNDDAAGANNGSNWTDAFVDLQSALALAQAGDEIWVAVGIYHPDSGTGDRTATLHLVDGVAVYGGFDGTETVFEDRARLFHVTLLSGDLDGDDAPVACTDHTPDCDSYGTRCIDGSCIVPQNIDDNSHHVVTGSGTGSSTVLDGFTITAGHSTDTNRGGGMYNEGGDPTVSNCTFSGNTAGAAMMGTGGGMYNESSSPVVTNCTFTRNWAAVLGGGMYNAAGSSPTLVRCSFRQNAAWVLDGGGILNQTDCHPILVNCDFLGNYARGFGGGVCSLGSSNPTLTNCLFSGNSVTEMGGGMYVFEGSPTLTNCTFSMNQNYQFGGGIYTEGTPTLTNCIFWGNVHDIAGGGVIDETAQIYGTLGSIDYSCVDGWTGTLGGTGNTGADPLFIDADGGDGTAGTADDDLRLSPMSPAIDAGNNAAVPGTVVTDLAGFARFWDDPNTADTGIGAPPIVDMGAYEFQYPGIPTLTEWGALVMTLPVLAAGAVIYARPRREPAP
jgi:hypothetical protein